VEIRIGQIVFRSGLAKFDRGSGDLIAAPAVFAPITHAREKVLEDVTILDQGVDSERLIQKRFFAGINVFRFG